LRSETFYGVSFFPYIAHTQDKEAWAFVTGSKDCNSTISFFEGVLATTKRLPPLQESCVGAVWSCTHTENTRSRVLVTVDGGKLVLQFSVTDSLYDPFQNDNSRGLSNNARDPVVRFMGKGIPNEKARFDHRISSARSVLLGPSACFTVVTAAVPAAVVASGDSIATC
jgi:hypothetical protein